MIQAGYRAYSRHICLFSISVFTFHPEKFVGEPEAVVVPLLPQCDLEAVLLQNEREREEAETVISRYTAAFDRKQAIL